MRKPVRFASPIAERWSGCLRWMLLTAMFLAGCRAKPERIEIEAPLRVTTPSMDELIAQTAKSGQAVMVLVTEFELSPADDAARTYFESPRLKDDSIIRVLLDVGVSRNRAEATRFHVPETPVLICLSSKGVIVSRDERGITQALVRQRISQLPALGRDLDSRLEALEKPVAANPNDATAQLALTDFLLGRHNAREAVPHLEVVAHADSSDATRRVRAWTDLARAHLWIAEPEKARREAKDLIATLGPTEPEAVVGGNLVLAMQDINGKRFTLAREELEAAIAAAPESPSAKQAREALDSLPPAAEVK